MKRMENLHKNLIKIDEKKGFMDLERAETAFIAPSLKLRHKD